MDAMDIITIIDQIITFLGVVFIVFNYFKNPQIKLEKGESLMAMSISQLGKDLANLRDNHIHTIDQKIDGQAGDIKNLAIEVTRLGTIIEERFPKNIYEKIYEKNR
jgi:hypothetical protein